MKCINSKKLLLGAVVAMCICMAGWLGEEVLAEEINVAASLNGGKATFSIIKESTIGNMDFVSTASNINDDNPDTYVGAYLKEHDDEAKAQYDAIVEFPSSSINTVEYVTSSIIGGGRSQDSYCKETCSLFYNNQWNMIYSLSGGFAGKTTRTIKGNWEGVTKVKLEAEIYNYYYNHFNVLNHYTYDLRAFKETDGIQLTSTVSTVNAVNLRGRVYGVYTGGSNRLSGVTITMKPHTYGYGARDYTTTSVSDGTYSFTDVLKYIQTSGGAITWLKYKIYVSAVAGYNDYVSEELVFDMAGARPYGIIDENNAYYDIKLRVKESSTGTVRGRVTDKIKGTGIPSATVTLTQRDSSITKTYRGATDANGYYTFTNLPKYIYQSSGGQISWSNYKVSVSKSGYRPQESGEDKFSETKHEIIFNFGLEPTSTPTPPPTTNTPPSILPGSLYIRGIYIYWRGYDAEDHASLQYAYRVDGGQWSVWGSKTKVTVSSVSKGLKKGKHYFYVKARDRQKLESEPASIEFLVTR